MGLHTLMKLSSLLVVGVALALFRAAPLAAQTLAPWEMPVKVVAVDGTLTKSAGCEGCPDSGAHSVARLTGDGYAEFAMSPGSRIMAGLSADLSEATASSTIDYAFSLWPGGAWEIRERGVYRKDGTGAAGDRFRVAVEGGRVVYRRNGAILYTSGVTPVFPLVLDATLYSMGATISGAAVVAVEGTVLPPPPPPPPDTSGPVVVAAMGPYEAAIDRSPHAKPALPVLGPAGSTFIDPVFLSRITRVTDGSTRPDNLDRSYKAPSSPHQNAWSATGSRFYVVGGGGAILPYSFDARTGAARRIQPSPTGAGGLVLNFYIEPQFSYVRDAIVYGSLVGGSLRTIDQYNFDTGGYSRVLDLDAVVPGLAGTYIGGIASSAGTTERIVAMFGGTRQDLHHYVVLFDAADPQSRQVLDTKSSTLNGGPAGTTLNFRLHHVMIDRSGRYVMLYPTSADQTGTRKAPQSVVWDTQTNLFTEMPVSSHPYGHDAFGYGVSVNKDCCTTTSYDAGQWQFRALSSPLVSRDVITTVLTPKEVYLSDHPTWNNARPDNTAPFISGLYRFGINNTTPWRAWDDEIIAVQSDAGPGANPTVWRFAHHRSNVAADNNAAIASFWYMPRPNVSPNGNWVLFTSNWEKTLGIDPAGEPGTSARQDVFLVALKSTVPPVSISSTSLGGGRATVPYAAALQASGGRGVYLWRVSSGALPAGLALDAATGAIGGTPAVPGTSAFTVAASDALDPLNDASAALTITVANPPVIVAVPALPPSRLTVPFSGALTATGGSGAFTWAVDSGALPAGLGLNAATGAISGTPVGVGIYDARVTAADAGEPANGMTVPVIIAVGAEPIRIITAALGSGRERVVYASTLRAAGGGGAAAWSVSSGTLPPGLVLNGTTGAISGKPTAAGSFDLVVTATDTSDAANTTTAAYAIVIAAGVKITSPRTLPEAAKGAAYTYAVQAANIQGTSKWDLAGGAMTPGMTLDPATGVNSGTGVRDGTWSSTRA